MQEPEVVIYVRGGVAEVVVGVDRKDVLIIDFDSFNELASQEKRNQVDQLLEEGKYNKVSEMLARVENNEEFRGE